MSSDTLDDSLEFLQGLSNSIRVWVIGGAEIWFDEYHNFYVGPNETLL